MGAARGRIETTGTGEFMVSENMQQRFDEARNRVITLGPRLRESIGVQQEKTVHAILKDMLDPDRSHQEVPVGHFIADVCNGSQIWEVQTANWGNLRHKLQAFLPEHTVTCVYPIPCSKWIIWINPETGELEKKNKSPLKGTFYQAFRELYRIRPFLSDPHLRIGLVLMDMEEYRLRDGYARDGRKGSHRYDRIPTRLEDILVLEKPEDYAVFLPESLPDTFTSKDLEKAAGVHRRTISYSQILLILSELGVVTRCGVGKNRAYLYRKVVSSAGRG